MKIKMSFSPIEFDNAGLIRRIIFLIFFNILGKISRFVWQVFVYSKSTFGHLSNMHRVLWRLCRFVGGIPRKKTYQVKVRLQKGLIMNLDLSRLTDSLCFVFGSGESEIGFIASKICPSEGVILDIGANIGTSTLFFSRVVDEGTVFAFEPSKEMRKHLTKNLNVNKIKNVKIFEFGLGNLNKKGRLEMAMEGNPGSSYFLEEWSNAESVEVEIRVLDELQFLESRLDLIKIDVEGFELKVLLGATETIKKFNPVIVLEINEPALLRSGNTSSELLKFLRGLNYEFFILDSGKLSPASPTHFNKGLFNLIAVSNTNNSAIKSLQN